MMSFLITKSRFKEVYRFNTSNGKFNKVLSVVRSICKSGDFLIISIYKKGLKRLKLTST